MTNYLLSPMQAPFNRENNHRPHTRIALSDQHETEYLVHRRNSPRSNRLFLAMSSLVVVATVCTSSASLGGVSALVVPTTNTRRFRSSTPSELFATDNTPQQDDNGDAQRLLQQAAKIRAEIAQMEGKSVTQVEEEARNKKEQQDQLRIQQHEKNKSTTTGSSIDSGRFLQVPNTIDDMVRQAARAVERAFQDGVVRQTVRLALLKDGQVMSTENNEFPGGVKEMYREAGKPLARELLKEISLDKSELRLPPIVKDQDIWDFDGSGLVTAQANEGPGGDVQALVFANTDVKYINDIETMDEAMGKDRLLLLMNPFWRNLDSWGFNIFAPNAKNKAQNVIFDRGFDETYVLLRFSARGEQCVALKVYPYDWQLFAYRESDDYRFTGQETAIRLGSSEEEPTSAMFADLLNARPEFKLSRNMRQMKNMF